MPIRVISIKEIFIIHTGGGWGDGRGRQLFFCYFFEMYAIKEELVKCIQRPGVVSSGSCISDILKYGVV